MAPIQWEDAHKPTMKDIVGRLYKDSAWLKAFVEELELVVADGLTHTEAVHKVLRRWQDVAYMGDVEVVKYPEEEEFYRLMMEEPPEGVQERVCECRQPECIDCWESERYYTYAHVHESPFVQWEEDTQNVPGDIWIRGTARRPRHTWSVWAEALNPVEW